MTLNLMKSLIRNKLALIDTVYTEFEPALLRVTTPEPGHINNFTNMLQNRLDEHLDKNTPGCSVINRHNQQLIWADNYQYLKLIKRQQHLKLSMWPSTTTESV